MTSRSALPTPPENSAEQASPAAIAALIAAGMVSSINLGAANIALPEIGHAFLATSSDLTHVGFATTLGMAALILYLGRLSQSVGRSRMVRLGLLLSIPLSFAAAFAPSIGVLVAARFAIGVAGAMIYPNTLAEIAVTTSGPRRVRAIGLWFGCTIGAAALGPVVAGLLMSVFWWGVAFLVSVPVALTALALARHLPRRAGEDHAPVDHLSGGLVAVGILTLATALSLGGTGVAAWLAPAAGVAAVLVLGIFLRRQSTLAHPILDLRVLRRPTFLVAAVAGAVTVGTMLGAFFVGQQFLQQVLGYSTTAAGLAVLPTGIAILLISPRAAALGARLGGRTMLILGAATAGVGIALMSAWGPESSYLPVGVAYFGLGCAVGVVGTTVSRTLMASVSGEEVAMASSTSDLQSCIGGALLIAIEGSVLAMAYHHAFDVGASGPPMLEAKIAESVLGTARTSLASAQHIATTIEAGDAKAVTALALESFLFAFRAAIWTGVAMLAATAMFVAVRFPGLARERRLEADYGGPRRF
jgi:DHA2 family multidrug resistance protein-like MFS transporter